MKKLLLAACAALFVMGCNNETASTDETTTTATIDYAYLPDNHPPDNWLPGNQENVAMVLKSLKGFETGNIDQALEPFADSVRWTSDRFDEKLSKDSLRALFTDIWSQLSSVKVVMNDYESVISKDKKHEWVTLWYKQINTDKSGKVDSMAYVDDLKIENGKIVLFDEKGRRFPERK